jgi:hypothetical protein
MFLIQASQLRHGINTWVKWVNYADRTDKAVTLAYNRFQESWLVCIVTKSGADFSHYVVDVRFGINEQIGTPKLGDNIAAGDQLLAASNQKDEQLHGFFLELNFPAKATKLIATEI